MTRGAGQRPSLARPSAEGRWPCKRSNHCSDSSAAFRELQFAKLVRMHCLQAVHALQLVRARRT